MLFAAKSPFSLVTVVDVDGRLLHQVERQVIALFVALGPVDEPVLPENDALEPRVLLTDALQLQPQLKAGAQPWGPADLAAEYLPGQLLRAPGRGHGDHRVRIHVVDVGLGYERV